METFVTSSSKIFEVSFSVSAMGFPILSQLKNTHCILDMADKEENSFA